jgi:hypothetical protein
MHILVAIGIITTALAIPRNRIGAPPRKSTAFGRRPFFAKTRGVRRPCINGPYFNRRGTGNFFQVRLWGEREIWNLRVSSFFVLARSKKQQSILASKARHSEPITCYLCFFINLSL